jgi:hypothetical protein
MIWLGEPRGIRLTMSVNAIGLAEHSAQNLDCGSVN